MIKELRLPLADKDIRACKAGETILLSGELYTARDQAHKRLTTLLIEGQSLPIDLSSSVIYYCGPTPAPPHRVIGSCGPTTSSRMDPFTPFLMKQGLRAMVGKGSRSSEVVAAIKKYRGVYLQTYGGCGAYLNARVIDREVVAFPDLGPEAIYKLTVHEFPVVVAIASDGSSIF